MTQIDTDGRVMAATLCICAHLCHLWMILFSLLPMAGQVSESL